MAKKSVKTAILKSEQTLDFEASLTELEDLVTKMEAGDITLEASLQHFERGITLTRQCQQALQKAEQKVQILLSESDEPLPFVKSDPCDQ